MKLAIKMSRIKPKIRDMEIKNETVNADLKIDIQKISRLCFQGITIQNINQEQLLL